MSETRKIRDKVLPYCRGYGLDLGCGEEKITKYALGIDLKELAAVDLIYDASHLFAFPSDRQDYVYSSHLLEHLDDPSTALKEWIRVIKPGGYLVLYLPHKDYYLEENPEHKTKMDIDTVAAMLEDIGKTITLHHGLDVGEDRYSFFIVAQKKTEGY